jgi:hypothetical protein
MEITADETGITFGENVYDITWERLTEDGVSHWVTLLLDKVWFTRAVEDEFLRQVGKYYGYRG